ncbi:DUF1615 domain-containing protein [Luteimonas kalidii]|uniref:DUF1615 domain-containing protein n=1 Tax=Luteimonas kalidii TaxID=3042025 RepID=A0ABT6JPJ1_9GAMM|nr:DUF1615 domain-containing protein [Luteimonas kalidii]MDH5832593.1 DUF1615 domain-containing protein [Luteimonas kalidii]
MGWRRAVLAGAWLLLAALAGCATRPAAPPGPPPADTRAEIARRIPARVDDRSGWANDIQVAFAAQRIAPNVENICAVLAVIEQESGYVADPVVANLPRVARAEIDRRASALHVPQLLVDAALRLSSTDGRSYGERLAAVRTERELSELYEDMIGRVPMGGRLFSGRNPVQTGGAMQVSIGFAAASAQGYPYTVQGSIRDEVFSRRGGLYFGIAHLLGYETPYTRKVHRFADYNAGWYASRNAAFQAAVTEATGIALALDGDLLVPGAPLDRPGSTERAVRTLSPQLGLDERAIRRALERGDRLDFGDGDLSTRVFGLAEAAARRPLPRARIPDIRLDSPKITRELTTAWFAERVDARYRDCLRR